MTLTGLPNSHWLTVSVISVSQPDVHRVECQTHIGKDGSLLEAAQNGQLIFQISHSEQLLVVAGKDTVLFFELRSTPKFSVDLLSDLTQEFSVNEYGQGFTIASCLCMPAPGGTVRNALDWVVLGEDNGNLYGFLWQMNQGTGRVELAGKKFYGRFPSKQTKHNRGISVGQLMATYGSSWNSQHHAVKEKINPNYADHLQQVNCEKDRFLSLGDSGKLLHWTLTKTGWLAKEEKWLDSYLENGCPSSAPGGERRILAAHSSRLVPNLLLLVDQSSRCMSCVDTSSPAAPLRAGQ